LEAWEKVYVKESFLTTTHGQLSCISCHGGNQKATTKTEAHVDIVANPSEYDDTYCSGCHAGTVSMFTSSLHRTQEGYYTLFKERAGYDLRDHDDLQMEFDKECGKCHTTCGQCHISRPESVEGGFIDGHIFKKTPSMTNNCTACHGSRIGDEFLGGNDGYRSDVHWQPNAKRCEFCHSAQEMHGGSGHLETRYDDTNSTAPKCEDCHEDVESDSIRYHVEHWQIPKTNDSRSLLQCQVCHSQDYKNCNACHTGGDGITGSSYMTYKIGKNHLQSLNRPYDYIVVRHIPVIQDTYASWGVGDLGNFDYLPTWKYATPHNIQRWTARTDTTGGVTRCSEKCHDRNSTLGTYLRESDLEEYEKNANQNVIIP
jgi:thiosulfate/3-mercaptopyruvate sulfurtransferase